jgi:hypothetical protein
MSEEDVIVRMLGDIEETKVAMGVTAHMLTKRGESLHELSNKSSELEAFSRSYLTEVERNVATTSCFAVGVLCFACSAVLGVIIVAFFSL